MTSLTSVELNFLVFRYLQESGFTHSAFTLGYEAGINKTNIDGNMVPPGALIKFVQKGLHYMEMEANLSNNEGDADEDFSFFQPLDLITKDVNELQNMLRDKKRKERDREKERDRSKENNNEVEREHERDHNQAKEKDRYEKQKERERERERERMEREKERERERIEREEERERERLEREKFEREIQRSKLEKEREMEREREREKLDREKSQEKQLGDGDREMVIDQTDKENARDEEHRRHTGAEPMDIVTASTSQTSHVPSSDVRILEGHTSEVCACAWSPSASLLASGSGDATARIWNIPEGSFRSVHTGRNISALILKHAKGKPNEKSKEVTTLDWNGEGTFLATGSCDGQARIWNTNGDLISTLSKHEGPIFSLKWNKKGDYLLTGSVDKTAVVWDVNAAEWKQQFEFHSGPTLDVDWRNNVSFATSSTDSMIYLCKIGETRPVRIFAGHQGEVNCVKWDPTGSLLASCSDDSTAKIWNVKQQSFVHDLRKHTKEIYTIRWSPTGPGTNNPNKQLALASASFDSTVKLWDAELGKMLCSYNGHREPVYSLAFSPNGEYIASGSLDRSIQVWSIKEGKLLKTYTGNGGIFEVCWNKEGNKIAACFADNSVCVLDFRM